MPYSEILKTNLSYCVSDNKRLAEHEWHFQRPLALIHKLRFGLDDLFLRYANGIFFLQYTGLYKLAIDLIWAPAHIKTAEVCPY